jgi:hypothetical protein
MIVKEAKYKNVMVKQTRCVSEAVYGCDECAKVIDDYPNEINRLELTVFKHTDSEADHLHFCSWRCVLKHITKLKSDYFVSLPFVHFDVNNGNKRNGKELISILKKLV